MKRKSVAVSLTGKYPARLRRLHVCGQCFTVFSISSPLHRDFVARTSRFTRLRKNCKLREHGPIFTQTTGKRQTKSKKDSKSDKETIGRSDHKIGWCISRRRFARTSGWTYEREPVHPEEERHDIPRGNLDFKQKTQNNSSKPGNTWDHLWELSRVVLNIMAAPKCLRLLTKIQITRRGQKMMQEKQLVNGQKVSQNSRNLPGERSYILLTKDGVESSICLDCQSRRNRLCCGFWCLHAYDEQDGKDIGRTGIGQSDSTSHDCDPGEWVGRPRRPPKT